MSLKTSTYTYRSGSNPDSNYIFTNLERVVVVVKEIINFLGLFIN